MKDGLPPSPPNSSSSEPAPPRPLNTPGHARTVLVWETQNPRLQVITRMILGDGFRARWIRALFDIQELRRSPACSVAIVALGGMPSPHGSSVQAVRALKERGFKIICYEDNAESWPVAMRCQALLAGALCLLDSAKRSFRQELLASLSHLMEQEVKKRQEEEQIKNLMKHLGLVGKSKAMISVFSWILRVSKLSDLPVLITGETGTGKELVAQAIYRLDPKRCKGPFVPINCGAISSGLAESELFGHRRGAFTGADQDRRGLIRAAQGGVLFLDEIGEMELALQTKLLRVLQESRVLGVGEEHELPVSVRVIAASNQELDQMVQQRRFRADLFHRLSVLSLNIRPLRERIEDIEPLIHYFLHKHGVFKGGTPLIDSGFADALRQLELPGNARQLENLVRRAIANKEDDTPLTLSDLAPEVWQELWDNGKAAPGRCEPDTGRQDEEARRSVPQTPEEDLPAHFLRLLDIHAWTLPQCLGYCEKLLLKAALQISDGNQSRTARLLGITPRSVYNKIHKHNLQHLPH